MGLSARLRSTSIVNTTGPRLSTPTPTGGRTFRGATLRSLALSMNWSGPARRAVAKYPVGSTVTVFVNPKYPLESVLERGVDPKFIPFMLFFAALFLVPGLMLLLR